jgi:hypothetical protein
MWLKNKHVELLFSHVKIENQSHKQWMQRWHALIMCPFMFVTMTTSLTTTEQVAD